MVAPGNALQVDVDYDLVNSDNCVEDYIELRVDHGAGDFLSALCGNGSRDAIVPGSAWVKFRSDNEAAGKGFMLRYSYGKFQNWFSFLIILFINLVL